MAVIHLISRQGYNESTPIDDGLRALVVQITAHDPTQALKLLHAREGGRDLRGARALAHLCATDVQIKHPGHLQLRDLTVHLHAHNPRQDIPPPRRYSLL